MGHTIFTLIVGIVCKYPHLNTCEYKHKGTTGRTEDTCTDTHTKTSIRYGVSSTTHARINVLVHVHIHAAYIHMYNIGKWLKPTNFNIYCFSVFVCLLVCLFVSVFELVRVDTYTEITYARTCMHVYYTDVHVCICMYRYVQLSVLAAMSMYLQYAAVMQWGRSSQSVGRSSPSLSPCSWAVEGHSQVRYPAPHIHVYSQSEFDLWTATKKACLPTGWDQLPVDHAEICVTVTI